MDGRFRHSVKALVEWRLQDFVDFLCEIVLQQAWVLFKHFFTQGVKFLFSDNFLVIEEDITGEVHHEVFLNELSFLGFPLLHFFSGVLFEFVFDGCIIARVVDLGFELLLGGFDVLCQFLSKAHHRFLGSWRFLLGSALAHNSAGPSKRHKKRVFEATFFMQFRVKVTLSPVGVGLLFDLIVFDVRYIKVTDI